MFWALTASLCLVWGMMQAGPMFESNSYFCYSVIYCAALLVCAVAAARLAWLERLALRAALIVGSVATACIGMSLGPFPKDGTGMKHLEAARAALRADPAPALPKMAVFPHEAWSDAASVILALQRAGVRCYVEPQWQFMFQKRQVAPPASLTNAVGSLSVWRIVHQAPADASHVALTGKVNIVFGHTSLSPTEGLIDFSTRGNWELYQLRGFSDLVSDFVWIHDPEAVLQFRPKPAACDVELEIVIEPRFLTGKPGPQPVELRLNGQSLPAVFLAEAGILRTRITRDAWNQSAVAHLSLRLLNTGSPSKTLVLAEIRRSPIVMRRLTTKKASGPAS
jgi:hypothetical protein